MELFKMFGSIFIKDNEAGKKLNDIDKKGNSVAKTLDKMGKSLEKAGKKMTTWVTAPILGLGAGLAKAAMDLESTKAKYNTVFDGMTAEADAFISKFQELTPATTSSARSMASGLQDLLVPMGFMREEATNMTGEMMHVVGALANFNSGTHSAEQVASAMQSALLGQYQSLASLGIQLDVTTVKQKAVEMGLADSTDEVTKQHQAQVMLKEVYAQSGDALDAYTEANLDAQTKMLLMKAEIIDVAASFGEHLLPLINKAIDIIRGLSERFAGLTEEQQKTVLIVGAIVAAIGPFLIIIGKVITVTKTLIVTAKALGVVVAGLTWPIGLTIAAIAALIAIGVLLYRNWDEIKYKFNLMTDWIAEKARAFADTFKAVWTGIWEGAKSTFTGIIEGIKNGFKSGLNWIIGKINTFVGKANSILQGLNSVPGVNVPTIPNIPMLAKGGKLRDNGMAIVGEQGPELISNLKGATVTPLGGNGGGITININNPHLFNERDADRLGQLIVGRVRTATGLKM